MKQQIEKHFAAGALRLPGVLAFATADAPVGVAETDIEGAGTIFDMRREEGIGEPCVLRVNAIP
jgi:hypothetical protein